ncbi:glutamyl-tRNA(Gln) amidotransferase subunit B, mitochondrial [Nilaparvata lugens]|uniref:glutamyl-tRNA(Gln) amidotransferase subunit B, mitochondrial n=1 Tax=Nilaparvata lugens TaxID=108931 RepID=UPI00193EB907|nr:glutamyl-tRNA(Gln) amidotransferase subunit B, mitochondrial [Nilaparvata lugens]
MKRIAIKYFNNKTINRNISSQSKWKGVVGLEIHAQINTSSKLFSGASTSFVGHVNNHVSLFDASIPGTLPVLNKRCVEYGILTSLALNCRINPVSLFDRKHYFYADLPAGYQITQQRKPLARNGIFHFEVFKSGNNPPLERCSRIHQIQLEQDSGKSIHDEQRQRSLVDLNRAGIPLMEIVFEPDLSNGEEAAALVQELMLVLTLLGTCNCKMEEGSLRVDANVSVHKPDTPLGTRSEIKNIGSIRAVAKAIDFEIDRQISVLESGKTVANETRSWNAETNSTVPMRDKEMKQDYRFMPEPNLPPLHIELTKEESSSNSIVSAPRLKKTLPELPAEMRIRLRSYKLTAQDVFTLVNVSSLRLLFERMMTRKPSRSATKVAHLITVELLAFINREEITLDQCDDKLADRLGEIIDLLQERKINLVYARNLIQEIIDGNESNPIQIVENNNWYQIVDETELKKICVDCIENNSDIIIKLRKKKNEKTKDRLVQNLMDNIFKLTEGKADLKKTKVILKEVLSQL